MWLHDIYYFAGSSKHREKKGGSGTGLDGKRAAEAPDHAVRLEVRASIKAVMWERLICSPLESGLGDAMSNMEANKHNAVLLLARDVDLSLNQIHALMSVRGRMCVSQH